MVEFHTPTFNGPLDLLLALIQKNEVNIYDIPVSIITVQFLDYIHTQEQIGLEDLSEFYKMAADLIWIKSQMLLPKQVEFSDEYQDPREELVQKLLEYSKYRKYSELLEICSGENEYIPKRKDAEFILPFSDDELIESKTINDLVDTLKTILSKQVVDEKVFNVYEQVSEKSKMALMYELLDKKESIRFTELFEKTPTPMNIICSFLAVLESVKDKQILVSQSVMFGDMDIRRRQDSENVGNYSND